MADNSDTEDALILDEEDQAFLQQDMQAGASEVIIEPAIQSKSTSAAHTSFLDPTIRLVSKTIVNPIDSSEPIQDANPSSGTDKDSLLQGPFPEFKWKTNTYTPYNFYDANYEFGKINVPQQSDLPKPLDIFEVATNIKSLIEDIVMPETLRYAHENGFVFNTDLEEITAFIGMNYVMGYHVLPTLRSYWSTEPDMGVPYVANVMPLSRFEEIRRNLHFCNNASQPSQLSPNFDRAYKIRPVMDHFNLAFKLAMNNTKTQAIDEHMVKFKGHNIMKQYMQNKPVKRGFKMWCRADSETGYLFQFDLYTGKKKAGPEVGLGEAVVLDLTKTLTGLGCEIYLDNFFNSPIL